MGARGATRARRGATVGNLGVRRLTTCHTAECAPGTAGAAAASEQLAAATAAAPATAAAASRHAVVVKISEDDLEWVYRTPEGNVHGPFSNAVVLNWHILGYFNPYLFAICGLSGAAEAHEAGGGEAHGGDGGEEGMSPGRGGG